MLRISECKIRECKINDDYDFGRRFVRNMEFDFGLNMYEIAGLFYDATIVVHKCNLDAENNLYDCLFAFYAAMLYIDIEMARKLYGTSLEKLYNHGNRHDISEDAFLANVKRYI